MAKTNRIVRNLDDAIKIYGGKHKFANSGQRHGTAGRGKRAKT
jgi:hypothetical protein